MDKETLKDILLGFITLSGRKGVSTSQLAAAFSKKPEVKDTSPKVSFAEYLQTVQRHQAANKDKVLRNGQIHFNVLCDIHPSLAETIRGGDLDPFYRDDLLPSFIEHLSKEWDSEGLPTF